MSRRGLRAAATSYDSSYSSSSDSSSTYSSSYASYEEDPCAEGGHRRLAGDGGCDEALGLFDFAFVSSSDYVVYSFMIVITIAAEVVLEHLEEKISEVYHKVLQKLYKELMLLGLISFGLFIARISINDLDADHTHSFEYAHFVMLFVGVLQCVQTTWACYCNREIKKQVWIGCNSV
eukprot:CAMPEP_0171886214 /NCGR_PEP_ID=MMETSP0992-20121227/41767_1 /TAXON_ID=483369 /ORGANISM="non described non described, Strain CCMP2098" /LENGTH=176 /DNA_ID=CAMNT_0012512829 /DNA_START=162 /DNA_END=688 /DNA_ORIENTATION=-